MSVYNIGQLEKGRACYCLKQAREIIPDHTVLRLEAVRDSDSNETPGLSSSEEYLRIAGTGVTLRHSRGFSS